MFIVMSVQPGLTEVIATYRNYDDAHAHFETRRAGVECGNISPEILLMVDTMAAYIHPTRKAGNLSATVKKAKQPHLPLGPVRDELNKAIELHEAGDRVWLTLEAIEWLPHIPKKRIVNAINGGVSDKVYIREYPGRYRLAK